MQSAAHAETKDSSNVLIQYLLRLLAPWIKHSLKIQFLVFGPRVGCQRPSYKTPPPGGGESARPEAQSNFFFYWKRALPQPKKEGPPEHLILALLHKCADTGGPGWQLSRRHCPEGTTKTSGGREVEREERKKGPQHKACRIAWQWSQQDSILGLALQGQGKHRVKEEDSRVSGTSPAVFLVSLNSTVRCGKTVFSAHSCWQTAKRKPRQRTKHMYESVVPILYDY